MMVKDQIGREIDIKKYPERIVSLVPSITELLVFLGLEENIVGVTKFCVHPEELLKTKTIIGGTKQINIDKIRTLQTDLIIGNKEENVREQIEILEKEFPVWMSDVNTYEDALQMIKSIGKITGTEDSAEYLVEDIENEFRWLKQQSTVLKNKRVLYLIWYNPYMAVANNTFIHSMIEKSGMKNVLENQTRYVEITIEDIKTLNPDLILLSSEPFPFKEKHRKELEEALEGKFEILFVDGELFSWYGVRMLLLPNYLLRLEMKM
ncbi:MAG: iron ABC transporter [Bacteroidia bacterium]|nr:MAG: iron ABC transporter [Bacteroidia bacterium]